MATRPALTPPRSLTSDAEALSSDEQALIAEFIAFLKEASEKRYPTGPMLRFNQGRQTACVDAELTVLPELAPELRAGLFATPCTYHARVRFANAGSKSDLEKDVRGMAIKVTGVEGDNLTPGVRTQDFVLNSHPVMVAGTTRNFLGLLRAMEAGGLQRLLWLLSHPRALRIGLAARAHHTSHLDIPYWSTTPYQFGEQGSRPVKYVVRPTSSRTSALPAQLTDSYLRDAMRAHLGSADASFDFMVQFQTDARAMPIEDASVEWSERLSPARTVARLRIPKQDIDATDRARRCEEAAFDPWHSLAAHRPLGGMNRARRVIYPAMAAFRAERRATSAASASSVLDQTLG